MEVLLLFFYFFFLYSLQLHQLQRRQRHTCIKRYEREGRKQQNVAEARASVIFWRWPALRRLIRDKDRFWRTRHRDCKTPQDQQKAKGEQKRKKAE
jgi:hypothetical protein